MVPEVFKVYQNWSKDPVHVMILKKLHNWLKALLKAQSYFC